MPDVREGSEMNRQIKVLSINGSYRDQGITDQAVAAAVKALLAAGADVENVLLRDRDIRFCLNCRACAQAPGHAPGDCVHHDDMSSLVEKIEQADAYILAAPTNFSSVTAIFKRFMERLAVYGYWPWGAPGPKYRKAGQPRKKALLISSCAAPGLLGRLVYSTGKQLKLTARLIGARPVGQLVTGLVSDTPAAQLPLAAERRAARLAKKLL